MNPNLWLVGAGMAIGVTMCYFAWLVSTACEEPTENEKLSKEAHRLELELKVKRLTHELSGYERN